MTNKEAINNIEKIIECKTVIKGCNNMCNHCAFNVEDKDFYTSLEMATNALKYDTNKIIEKLMGKAKGITIENDNCNTYTLAVGLYDAIRIIKEDDIQID